MSAVTVVPDTTSPTTRLRWLTVPAGADPAAVPDAVRDALTAAGLEPSDVLHLKVWTPSVIAVTDLPASWLALFPAPERRPSLSVIPSPPADGETDREAAGTVGTVVTVVAAGGAQIVSTYEDHQSQQDFPSAASDGEHLFVAALVPRGGGDVGAQAVELFARLQAVVEKAGGSPDGLGHLFVWYQDHSVRDVVNDPYLALFDTPGDRPARHSVVRELPAGAALMIEAVGSLRGVRSCYTIGGLWHGGIGGVPNSLPFGTRCGDLLLSAGTYGRDPGDGSIPDDFEGQLRWAVHYAGEFLRVAGMSGADVGHVYLWVREDADAGPARDAVLTAFGTAAGAPSVQVLRASLPGTNRIQIELVAQH